MTRPAIPVDHPRIEAQRRAAKRRARRPLYLAIASVLLTLAVYALLLMGVL